MMETRISIPLTNSRSEGLLFLWSFRQRPAFFKVLALILVVSLSGCATLDSNPFTEFHVAANEITAIDAIVGAHVSTVEESEMERLAQDPDGIKLFKLDFDENNPFKYGYGFEGESEPLFVKWQRVETGLYELNLAFIEYTRLLLTLADGDLVNTEDFDRLAEDLNTNARSALESLGRQPDASSLGLFSVAASEAARAYINSKRTENLKNIIIRNQQIVDSFIDRGRVAVSILARDIQAPYLVSIRAMLKQWLSSTSSAAKRKIADIMFKKSQVTVTTLELLRSMDRTYAALSDTHKSLVSGIDDGRFSVSRLKASVSRLQKLYKKLESTKELAKSP